MKDSQDDFGHENTLDRRDDFTSLSFDVISHDDHSLSGFLNELDEGPGDNHNFDSNQKVDDENLGVYRHSSLPAPGILFSSSIPQEIPKSAAIGTSPSHLTGHANQLINLSELKTLFQKELRNIDVCNVKLVDKSTTVSYQFNHIFNKVQLDDLVLGRDIVNYSTDIIGDITECDVFIKSGPFVNLARNFFLQYGISDSHLGKNVFDTNTYNKTLKLGVRVKLPTKTGTVKQPRTVFYTKLRGSLCHLLDRLESVESRMNLTVNHRQNTVSAIHREDYQRVRFHSLIVEIVHFTSTLHKLLDSVFSWIKILSRKRRNPEADSVASVTSDVRSEYTSCAMEPESKKTKLASG